MIIAKSKKPRDAETSRHSMRAMFDRGLHAVTDLVFPPRCLICRNPAESVIGTVCSVCREAAEAERSAAFCPTCANSVGPWEVSGNRCRQCRAKTVRVSGIVRIGEYKGCLGYLIRAYKYHGREELDRLLGGWLSEKIRAAPWFERIEAVVPVPTHWKHRLKRRLYPAERLAALVAKITGLPNVPVLRRVRGGPHQIGLSYSQRIENVRGAFALRRGVTLRDARLLILDDVKTTGATIDECTKVLRRAGAAEVYAAVVAKAGWSGPTGQPISFI